MASLLGPRRPPWIAGAALLALIALFLTAALVYFGARRWPIGAGLGALLLLAMGALENAWRSRPLPRRRRSDRRRFQLVAGGKGERKGNGKGNGHAQDLPDPPRNGDKPRWVM